MNRITLLLIIALAMVATACGGAQTAESAGAASQAAATTQPTAEPTPEPEEPAESTGTGGNEGSGTALVDLLPDEIGGQSRTDVDLANNPMFAEALASSGTDLSDVEYLISTYGTGTETLVVTSMRIPEMGKPELEAMARMMTGVASADGSADVVTVGGKSVISITPAGSDQGGYMYFADGAAFIIVGTSEDQAAELLTQLP
jgi:hypothetical protein